MDREAMLEHYKRCDSDKRLEDRIGLIEFNTTMDYIHKYFSKGAKILEIGACTGAKIDNSAKRELVKITLIF